MSVSIPEELAEQNPEGDSKRVACPTSYKLSAIPNTRQQLVIYSQEPVGKPFSVDGAEANLTG